MMESVKNSAAVQSFVQLPKKNRKIAVATLLATILIIVYFGYSIFAPVQNTAANEAGANAVGEPTNLRAQPVGDSQAGAGSNVNNPQLRPTLDASEKQRKEQSTTEGDGSYVADNELKDWSSKRQGALLDNKAPKVTQTKNETSQSEAEAELVEKAPKKESKVYLTVTPEQFESLQQNKRAAMQRAYISFRTASKGDGTTSFKGNWKPSGKGDADNPVNVRTGLRDDANGGPVGGFVPGDTLIAFTTSEVNSDTTTIIIAEVGAGPLAGAKVPLKVTRVDGYVVFESTSIAWDRNSAPFKAIALDPGVVASNGFSTSTDRHIMLRYGMLFFSAFAEGAGELSQAAINDVTVNGETITSQSNAKTKDYVIAGAGKVGQKLGTVAEKVFDTPPTVRVRKGQEMALVVIDTAHIPWLPEPYRIKQAVGS